MTTGRLVEFNRSGGMTADGDSIYKRTRIRVDAGMSSETESRIVRWLARGGNKVEALLKRYHEVQEQCGLPGSVLFAWDADAEQPHLVPDLDKAGLDTSARFYKPIGHAVSWPPCLSRFAEYFETLRVDAPDLQGDAEIALLGSKRWIQHPRVKNHHDLLLARWHAPGVTGEVAEMFAKEQENGLSWLARWLVRADVAGVIQATLDMPRMLGPMFIDGQTVWELFLTAVSPYDEATRRARIQEVDAAEVVRALKDVGLA